MGRLRLPHPSINPISEHPPETSPPSLISSEITSLLAILRRNLPFSPSPSHSLILSLQSLRRLLFSPSPPSSPLPLLRPFLDIIRSHDTSPLITSAALSSLLKIVSSDLFHDRTDAINAVVDAVAACRFEIADPASEEVVLMKILQVLLACLRSGVGGFVSDQHVCNVVNTCFRVVHQAGSKGELLQRFSRMAMHEVVRCVFARLPEATAGNAKVSFEVYLSWGNYMPLFFTKSTPFL